MSRTPTREERALGLLHNKCSWHPARYELRVSDMEHATAAWNATATREKAEEQFNALLAFLEMLPQPPMHSLYPDPAKAHHEATQRNRKAFLEFIEQCLGLGDWS